MELSYIYPVFLLQCSVSCGEGTQTRSATCQRVLKTGVSTVVNSTLCPPLPFSSSIRPCMLATCASEYVRALGWDGFGTPWKKKKKPASIATRQGPSLSPRAVGHGGTAEPKTSYGWSAQLEMKEESSSLKHPGRVLFSPAKSSLQVLSQGHLLVYSIWKLEAAYS